MARAVSSGTSPPAAPERGRTASWVRACAFAAASGGAVLAMYLAHPLLSGFDLPVGPDGPVYVWWTRYAGGAGLEAVPGARPGLPALALALQVFLRTDAVGAVTVLGPVLAATSGLAGAALLEAALGPRVVRAAAAPLMPGAFAAYLAGGWLGNTALVALFLAAAAALALARASWRAVAGAAALLAAAAVAHRIAIVLVLTVLGGVVLTHVPEALRERRRGVRGRDTFAVRAGVAVAAAAGVAAAALLPALGAPRLPGDTSQDGFFRRHGLRALLVDRYRERLGGDAARALIPITTGLGLGAIGVGRRPSRPGERFLLSLVASWAAITIVAVALFAATAGAPPNRVLVFAFFIPLAAAAGVSWAWRRAPLALAALASVAAVAFVGVSMLGWARQSPAFSSDELTAAREAGRTAASLPPGTPLVFAVDTFEPAAAYHVTRAFNVIRAGLPPERIPDAHVVVGAPEDVVAGRTTTNGDPEHDAIARAYLAETSEATRSRPPFVFVVEAFNP
ncbi:MAG TPA: hypothetical protein VG709_02770, partial [Actinomycetota bacterium]|nr:hypothetical protein [Actinomycetota bacterium]